MVEIRTYMTPEGGKPVLIVSLIPSFSMDHHRKVRPGKLMKESARLALHDVEIQRAPRHDQPAKVFGFPKVRYAEVYLICRGFKFMLK